jgi:hypothetical protein
MMLAPPLTAFQLEPLFSLAGHKNETSTSAVRATTQVVKEGAKTTAIIVTSLMILDDRLSEVG